MLYCTPFCVAGIVFYASDFEDYGTLKVFNHEKVRYGCTRCKKTYQQKKTLGRHLRFDCGQQPAFVCQMCSKAFKHGYILLKHMRNTHDIFIQKLRQRQVTSSAQLPKGGEIQLIQTGQQNVNFKIVKNVSSKHDESESQIVSVHKKAKISTEPQRVLNFEHGIFGNADVHV